MHTSSRFRFARALRVFAAAGFALLLAAAAAAADPSGGWAFKAEGPNGHSLESTLTLKWANNQLSGTIDNRAGKAEIRDARFSDDRLSFSVERKVRRRTVTTRYSGKLEGDTITGTIQFTPRTGEPVSIPWAAHRVSR